VDRRSTLTRGVSTGWPRTVRRESGQDIGRRAVSAEQIMRDGDRLVASVVAGRWRERQRVSPPPLAFAARVEIDGGDCAREGRRGSSGAQAETLSEEITFGANAALDAARELAGVPGSAA
jgi:hypothetical protein